MSRLYAALFLLLALPAAWIFYTHGKSSVIESMVAASRADDVAAMAALVDWESLRAFLKEDLAAQKKGIGGQQLPFGPELSQIDKVVDYYVQPENIDIAYYYHDELFPGVAEEQFMHEIGYAPPFGFQVTLGYPKNAETQQEGVRAARDRIRVRLVFQPEGLSWKVKRMHLPLFMVPRHVYSPPAAQVFGRIRK